MKSWAPALMRLSLRTDQVPVATGSLVSGWGSTQAIGGPVRCANGEYETPPNHCHFRVAEGVA